MATFPIPASYIDAGNGPLQIAIRDQNGQIPGLPVVYHRTMTDEVADVVKHQVASGWLAKGTLVGTLGVTPLVRNTIYLDATAGVEAVLNGYRLVLPRQVIAIPVPTAPVGGTRDDLIFLEVWFIRSEGGGRIMQYRFRVVPNVDFNAHSLGLGDPNATGHDETDVDTTIPYQQYPTQFDTHRDPGLWLSVRTGKINDPLSEAGLDGLPYRFSYALPLARVRRLNQGAYDPIINPTGAPSYDPIIPSARPDGGWNDAIDPTYQIVDLRQASCFVPADQRVFRKALADLLTNKLTSNGILRHVALGLDTVDYGSLRSDLATVDAVAIPANLVRHSHFENDANADGMADGWAPYVTGAGTGTRAMATPKGQTLVRTGISPSDNWGITQLVSGVKTQVVTLQFGFTVNTAAVGTVLNVLATNPVTGQSFFLQPYSGLSAYPFNQLQAQTATIEVPTWLGSFNLTIFLTGGNGSVTLNYVDIRPDRRLLPIMPVTDGSLYTVAAPSALPASFDATRSQMWDAITGTLIAGTIDVAVNGALEFRPSAPAADADVRLVLGLTYAGGSGLPDLFPSIDRAWELTGTILPVFAGDASDTFTASQLGQPIPAGEKLVGWNPTQAIKGSIATLRIPGNGGNTYTLPATKYGREVLWPVDCRIAVNSSQTLSSVVSHPDGTITITLANGASVPTTAFMEVDVALDMPVLLWDNRTNGTSHFTAAERLITQVTAATPTVVLAATGVIAGAIASAVCSNVLVNGVGVSLAVAIGIVVAGPTITLTFPNPLAPGDVVEVLALVQREFNPGSGVTVTYQTSTVAPVSLAPTTPMLVLTEPVLLAHTKGTGGADLDPDWGVNAFTRNPLLDGRYIALVGDTAQRTVLDNLPHVKNRLQGTPIYAGRVLKLADFTDASFVVESRSLLAAAPHAGVLAMLVSVAGRRLLLVLTEVRPDARTAVTVAASAALYEPSGRPISPMEG